MKIEIKNRWTGKIIFETTADSMRLAVEAAVKTDVNLAEADLYKADLEFARLDGARLDGARLVGARLDGARLDGASLVGARLDGARLVGARLDGARLDGARLDGARLDGARLDPIRNDVWAVLAMAPREVEGLLKALKEGRVDGSTYEGQCACLVGTIANVRGCDHDALGQLKPDAYRPAERFFLAIKKGDTPETSQFSKLAAQWVEQWLENVKGAFAVPA